MRASLTSGSLGSFSWNKTSPTNAVGSPETAVARITSLAVKNASDGLNILSLGYETSDSTPKSVLNTN